MASYETVKCPNPACDKELGPYHVESNKINEVQGTCGRCGQRYVVRYGQGQVIAIPKN